MNDSDVEVIMQALQRLDEATVLLRSVINARHADGRSTVEVDEEFLDRPVLSVDFGVNYTPRLQQLFRQGVKRWDGVTFVPVDIVTVRDLLSVTENQCRCVSGIGKRTVDRLQAVLAAHGVRLRQPGGQPW